MDKYRRYYERFAALSGFVGVLLGALAAHKAADAYTAELLQKASLYQLVHSLAILVSCARPEKTVRISCLFFAVGILLFCGGLALKALAGITLPVPVIPIGGTSLMLGWLALLLSSFKHKT